MGPQDALNVLDQVSASVPANRATHVQIQQALSVLQKFIDEKSVSDPSETQQEAQ